MPDKFQPKRIPFEEFKKIYSRVPRLTVEIIIITNDGLLLTLREINPYKGQWHFPGGTLLFGESVEDGAKRIAQEELGVEIYTADFLGYIEYPSERKTEGGFGQSVGLALNCKIITGTIKGGEQGKKISFFKNLPENIIEDQKIFLNKIGIN